MEKKRWFLVAAYLSFFMAAMQAVIACSPELAARFQAPARLLADPTKLLLAGWIAAMIPAAIACYGLSGAERIRRLPLLRTVSIIAGTVFTLRGLFIVASLLTAAGVLEGRVQYLSVASHLTFLAAGVCFLVGCAVNWDTLRPKVSP